MRALHWILVGQSDESEDDQKREDDDNPTDALDDSSPQSAYGACQGENRTSKRIGGLLLGGDWVIVAHGVILQQMNNPHQAGTKKPPQGSESPNRAGVIGLRKPRDANSATWPPSLSLEP